MHISAAEYQQLAESSAPRSPAVADCLKAFAVGGTICVIGQLITDAALYFGVSERTASLICTVALIALSVTLTGLGWYSTIAKHAGAGTLVPITGFANAVASPAIEFRSEGMILGLSAQMFTIAGPVITYGIASGVIYGLIYVMLDVLM